MVKNVEIMTIDPICTQESNTEPEESTQLLTAEFDWLLGSPVLMSPSAHPALLTQPFPDSMRLDCRNQLEKQVWRFYAMLRMRKSTRLGIRYETLWQYLHKINPDSAFLGSNLQVRNPQRTIGEFDLLYFSHSRRHYVHQELAVKFYLGKPGSTGDWQDWLGPDRSDRLSKKLDRLFKQQINLSHTDDGSRILCNLLGSTEQEKWLPEILLQGYLFYPWNSPCEAPAQSNPKHLRGDWLFARQIEDYCQQVSADQFTIPDREQWLALQSLKPSLRSMSSNKVGQTVCSLLLQINRPVLLVAHQETGNTVFFVVPDDWLAK